MGRWAREQDFDALVQASSASFGGRVAPEFIKAIIAAESAFRPESLRGEPQIGDASIGLMQLRLATARALGYPGAVGDPGALSGLYEPGTNIFLGTKLLDQLLTQTSGDLDAAASAYNGGYRPDLGFGALRTVDTPAVCLVWKSTAPTAGRTLANDCQVIGSTTPGTFSNQRYVDRVKDYRDYFFVAPPLRAAAPQ
jgi:soluble lytic murein transglycosylase-like protein